MSQLRKTRVWREWDRHLLRLNAYEDAYCDVEREREKLIEIYSSQVSNDYFIIGPITALLFSHTYARRRND